MAQLRIKRTAGIITDPKLLPGELGLIQDHIYIGWKETNSNDDTMVTAHPLASLDAANNFTGVNTFTNRPTVDGTEVALKTDVPALKSLTITKDGSNNIVYDPTDAAKTLNLRTIKLRGIKLGDTTGVATSTDLGTIDIFGNAQTSVDLGVYNQDAIDTKINTIQTNLNTQVEALKELITSGTKYLGTVTQDSPLTNKEPDSKGDFCRAGLDFILVAAQSITGAAVNVHSGDMLVCEAIKQGSTLAKWSVIHSDWKPNGATTDGYVTAVGGNTSTAQNNGGKFWGTDTNGNPQWTNVFQFKNRPTLNGVSSVIKDSVKDSAGNSIGDQLATRGEAVVTGVTCKITDEGTSDGWDWLVTNGSTISLGAAEDKMTVTNNAEKTKVVLPNTTYVRNSSGQEVLLANFGGSVKSITVNDFGTFVPGIDGEVTVSIPFVSATSGGMMTMDDWKKLNDIEEGANKYVLPTATAGALGGIKIGYQTSGKNYAVQLSDGKAYVNVPWTDTEYTLSAATDSSLGGIKLGYAMNYKNKFAVQLDNNSKAYVEIGTIDCGTWTA